MTEKIQSLTGMNDILPDTVSLWQRLETTCRQVFAHAGFAEIRTPLLEATALFSRGIGDDTQVVQKEMYTFLDKGGDSVTLRPEGTAGVVRAYIEHALQAQEEVLKLYYMGPMFRYERPQKGRLRQFHQIGVEVFGVDSPFADAEVITLADRIAKGVGLSGYQLFLNTLGTKEEREPYLAKLIIYFSKFSHDLCGECQKRLHKNVLRIFDCKNPQCASVAEDAPFLMDDLSPRSRGHFESVQNALTVAGVAFEVKPRVVRGLDYYEKTTFEFVSDQLGAQSAFCGGGRYNQLVAELGGKDTPGVGFGMGCERVIMLMEQAVSVGAVREPPMNGIYFVAIADRALPEAPLQKARELVQRLRDAGVRADAGFEAKSLKSQMRRANKLGYAKAAILGEDELAKNVVTLKDLVTGEQSEVPFEELCKIPPPPL